VLISVVTINVRSPWLSRQSRLSHDGQLLTLGRAARKLFLVSHHVRTAI
jgi:hypothetical protein